MASLIGTGVPLTLPQTQDGRPILTLAELQDYDPGSRRSGREERYLCPLHGSDHRRSFALNPQTGGYYCHTCKAKGTLRDFWPERNGRRPAPPTSAEVGRRVLDLRARREEQRAREMSQPLPLEASLFLADVALMQEALRDPTCPGHAYLRERGLDPTLAVALGAGYAAPGTWPGDERRRVGRIVFPLGDPATGRTISALGRLCLDAQPSWRERDRALFATIKQRKLKGCPAGVWPSGSLAAALSRYQPVVVTEGPADALAALQGHPGLLAVALCGTANVLPAAVLGQLPGVVLALDADEPGQAAQRRLCCDLALAGRRWRTMSADWLGGAADLSDVLDPRKAPDHEAAQVAYARAVVALRRAVEALAPTGALQRRWAALGGWDDPAADAAWRSLIHGAAAAYQRAPHAVGDALADALDRGDAAYHARDWEAFLGQVARVEEIVISLGVEEGDGHAQSAG